MGAIGRTPADAPLTSADINDGAVEPSDLSTGAPSWDTSSNVLVGKTATDWSVAGAELRSNGTLWGTVDGNRALMLNRLTSDGEIATFYKDEVKVGNISTNGTSISIGFEGAAAANALDDYEEGTWTPYLWDDSNTTDGATYNNQDGYYTKIGNIVSIQFRIIWSSTGTLTESDAAQIGNLPFRGKTGAYSGGVLAYKSGIITAGTGQVTVYMGSGGNDLALYAPTAGTSSRIRFDDLNATGSMYGQITYEVA